MLQCLCSSSMGVPAGRVSTLLECVPPHVRCFGAANGRISADRAVPGSLIRAALAGGDGSRRRLQMSSMSWEDLGSSLGATQRPEIRVCGATFRAIPSRWRVVGRRGGGRRRSRHSHDWLRVLLLACPVSRIWHGGTPCTVKIEQWTARIANVQCIYHTDRTTRVTR
jgi:hypothetical protein